MTDRTHAAKREELSSARKLAYLPFFVRDFWSDAGVIALPWIRRAIYTAMLHASWEYGPLPDDPAAIGRLIAWDGDELEGFDARPAIAAILRDFWERDADGAWKNPRLERERTRAVSIVSRRDRKRTCWRNQKRNQRARMGLARDSSRDKPYVSRDKPDVTRDVTHVTRDSSVTGIERKCGAGNGLDDVTRDNERDKERVRQRDMARERQRKRRARKGLRDVRADVHADVQADIRRTSQVIGYARVQAQEQDQVPLVSSGTCEAKDQGRVERSAPNGARSRKPSKRPQASSQEEIRIPAAIDTPEVRRVLKLYQERRRELRMPRLLAEQLAPLEALGPEAAIACIEYSRLNGYRRLFPDCDDVARIRHQSRRAQHPSVSESVAELKENGS